MFYAYLKLSAQWGSVIEFEIEKNRNSLNNQPAEEEDALALSVGGAAEGGLVLSLDGRVLTAVSILIAKELTLTSVEAWDAVATEAALTLVGSDVGKARIERKHINLSSNSKNFSVSLSLRARM